MSDPIFKSIFGAAWDNLPPVMKKHYANRTYTDDHVTVEGTLDVMCAGPIRALAPLFWLLGSIPPINQKNVPVTVHFRSSPDTKKFHFQRVFHFQGRKPYHFRSYMIQVENNDVVEITGGGMGWRMLYDWENGKVVMKHKGYALRLFGHYIPLPLEIFLGKGYAEEVAVDDNTFDMQMHLTHPRWGKIYEYKGQFKVVKQVKF